MNTTMTPATADVAATALERFADMAAMFSSADDVRRALYVRARRYRDEAARLGYLPLPLEPLT